MNFADADLQIDAFEDLDLAFDGRSAEGRQSRRGGPSSWVPVYERRGVRTTAIGEITEQTIPVVATRHAISQTLTTTP